MSSTFIEHSPKADEDKSLILIMDGDGNVTADPAHFEKLITNQKLPDMGIKIVRLDTSQGENENSGDNESNQELKLTVEEIYPENLTLGPADPMSSPLEILPGPSNEHISHDMVDPFSQMDPEQLQRLEHALASEQAKQILGENVAAMLDMLSVDDSPAAFLQNSIKNDHCYTNLLPSSDPNGPSFFMNDTRSEVSRGKGKAKVGTPIKGRKIVSSAIGPVVGAGGGVGVVKRAIIKEGKPAPKQQQTKQTTLLDYGTPVAAVPQPKVPDKEDDPAYEEDVDVEDSEGSGEEDDNLSDEDYNNRSTRTKRKPRKNKRKLLVKHNSVGRPFGRPFVKSGSRFGRRAIVTPEIRARNEKLNDAMSKIVESLDYETKVVEDKTDLKKGIRKIKPKTAKEEPAPETEKVIKEPPKPAEETVSTVKSQPAKYPKRENRKPPAHLAEAFGPALFSAPDIIRRVSTGEEIPPALPEKKNFTVGAKLADRGAIKPPPVPQPSEPQAKPKPKLPPKETKAVKPKTETPESSKVVKESHKEEKTPTVVTETGNKKPNIEIQKLIEKHQVKSVVYEEDQDYSDENIDENYYLDPTQMDQSLLEGFGQAAAKSEDQLLQEAILLQEQLIESNKGIVMPEGETMGLEENQVQIAFDSETIEDIQNEITSAILVAHEGGAPERKQTFQFDHETFNSGPGDSKKVAKTTENHSEGEADGGNLVVDEGKPEDRRRNSAKRRRSDEVSDLDSDMDDALSEASWNSEDDPDRLWCICRKPHNNRFMICCDVCEEWFHGKCVGITKTIGKQMEQDGLEWSCPNCTKKKKVEEHDREAEKIKLLKEKMAQSIKEQQLRIKESQKLKSQSLSGKEKSMKAQKTGTSGLKQTKISDYPLVSSQGSEEEETVGRKCIMCKGPVRENSIYCSDDCIRKHSQHAISQLMSDGNKKSGTESQGDNSKLVQKVRKEESRIVVMDPNSKKFLVGQNAPTAANLTTWLKENPSYHVVYKKTDKPGKILLTSRKVVKIASKPGEAQKVFVQKVGDTVKSTQLKLAVSPNSKQINILQSASGKKVFQILNSSNPSGKGTAFIVKQKQTEVIDALPLPVKTIVARGPPVKVNKEATSPKPGQQVAANKDSDKLQKKRKERLQKAAIPLPGKDPKMGQTSKQEEPKDKDKDKKDADQQIRDSVKKTLAETLKARVQECKEIEFNEEVIDGLAVKIEEKLFKHFENKVDTKYKSKYRSLVFNIKDPKNETLYKKIVDNSISPKELVKLSPEELASQELARWREKENQHQLEMIKKTELELMTKGNTYIMKSHKGEQVIETEQSEKVAAEIDPNTPAQELVSALNSVTSTTQDAHEDEEKKGSETSLMKMRQKEKERRRSRERKHDRRDKGRRRSSSRSRSRSHRSKNKKRSRSREKEKEKEKDKEKTKYRHKEKKADRKKDKDGKDGTESLEDKSEDKFLAKNEISTSEDVPLRKSVEDDESDRVPSSTVIIKTPDINMEEPEPTYLWKGSIVMADVAKFSGVATEISGDCGGLSLDIGDKVDVVGRIPFDTVWDYIARMKRMGTRDILVIKIVPVTEEEKSSYVTLYSYLSKRSRIGVIGKTSDAIKDFYLYPFASHSPLPQVLLPLDAPSLEGDRENIILGIIVRNKHRSRHLGISDSHKSKKVSVVDDEGSSLSETVPDRSYTPPLPDKDQDHMFKKERHKRKIRVRMDYKEIPSSKLEDEEDEEEAAEAAEEDDDSPYSPGDSDDDLPPLPKIPKPSIPAIPNSISKLLSPRVPTTAESNLQDPAEIQRKIEEMNRAIEEQTQQIQSLTSAVPKLAATNVLPALPLLATVTSAILTPPTFPSSGSGGQLPPATAPTAAPKPPPPAVEKVQLPLISSEPEEETSSPPRSFTPPIKVEENIPFLPEVTSKISLPSNLQEILNSIQQKKSEEPETAPKEVAKPVEEIIKADDPEIKMALNVLNQTKTLLTSLSTIKTPETAEKEDPPLLSRLTDEELLLKAKEMEMETVPDESAALIGAINPYPPHPLPPGVQDIPLLPPAFANPPPPPYFPKTEKKPKLDPKAVFENEGVPDFNIPGSSWDDKKGQKAKSFKIDIKLAMNSLEKKQIDMDHFDIESITKMPEERHLPAFDDRLVPKPEDKYRGGHDRRRSDDRETKRDWKYRRHWDEDKRYKEDYRRHGRRDRPKFRKDRFDHKAARHEWDGGFEQRWRGPEARREEARRSRKRADSSSN